MFIKDVDFKVKFSSFAERYFCKDFLKKYKSKIWSITYQSIIDVLNKSFGVQKTGLIDNIKFSQEEDLGIFRLDFRAY